MSILASLDVKNPQEVPLGSGTNEGIVTNIEMPRLDGPHQRIQRRR